MKHLLHRFQVQTARNFWPFNDFPHHNVTKVQQADISVIISQAICSSSQPEHFSSLAMCIKWWCSCSVYVITFCWVVGFYGHFDHRCSAACGGGAAPRCIVLWYSWRKLWHLAESTSSWSRRTTESFSIFLGKPSADTHRISLHNMSVRSKDLARIVSDSFFALALTELKLAFSHKNWGCLSRFVPVFNRYFTVKETWFHVCAENKEVSCVSNNIVSWQCADVALKHIGNLIYRSIFVWSYQKQLWCHMFHPLSF